MKKVEEKIQQLETQIHENHVNKETELLITEMKKIGIEKLPYSYSALKQFIDSETMNFHYNVMEEQYKGKYELIYSDTDSFVYRFKCSDVVDDILRPHKNLRYPMCNENMCTII
jgi:superoxide dismutase